MAQSALEVANSALIKLGASVTVVSLSSDTTKEAQTCNSRLEICKRAVLRAHPWNFATKRDTISKLDTAVITSITPSGGTQTVLNVIGHGFSLGDWIMVSSSAGTNIAGFTGGPYKVSNVSSANQFSIYLAPSSWTSSTFVADNTCFLSNAFDFTYRIALPTDCLRVLFVNETTSGDDWRVEGRYLVTDDADNDIRYIFDVTDYTVMDIQFYEALAHYLAWDICFNITQSNELKDQLLRDYKASLSMARFSDATEDSQQKLEATEWVAARFSPITEANVFFPGSGI